MSLVARLGWLSVLGAAACGNAPPPASPPPAPHAALAPPADKPATPSETGDDSDNGCPEHLRAIAGGTLYMGSSEGKGSADEHPQHKVTTSDFCLGESEVTVADYRACEKNKACDVLPDQVRLDTELAEGEQAAASAQCAARLSDNAELPATCVSFAEASRYCAWKGQRLPTEAEWEWAATGGDDKLDWPWGQSMPTAESACWQRQHGPCPVKGTAAGAFDLFGMAGNAAEWTSTPYGPYEKPAPKSDVLVVRGGSWETTKGEDLGPKRRDSRQRTVRDTTLGFRCAKSK
jgi:formylglycine-generating enzyme required for sulfatase activity